MKKIVKNGYEFAKKTIKLAHLSRASFCSLYFSYIYQEPSEVGYNGFFNPNNRDVPKPLKGAG